MSLNYKNKTQMAGVVSQHSLTVKETTQMWEENTVEEY